MFTDKPKQVLFSLGRRSKLTNMIGIDWSHPSKSAAFVSTRRKGELNQQKIRTQRKDVRMDCQSLVLPAVTIICDFIPMLMVIPIFQESCWVRSFNLVMIIGFAIACPSLFSFPSSSSSSKSSTSSHLSWVIKCPHVSHHPTIRFH